MNERAAPQPGEILAGKYVVERVLGEGGMGVVVAAHHRELDARVAIKLLRTRPAPSVESVERFQREARAAARLKSDHVARVNDVGVLPDGTPFMVLEHLEGADLAEILRGGAIAPGLAAELVAQACEAVGEAHAQDIVHRDLKPSNLFVTRTVRGIVRVKVLDFGISKLRTSNAEAMAETAQGAMLGTPLYMSPEQMRSSRDVDARTDVWSLGLVLFELCTGRVPWSTSSIAALALDVTTTPAPDPRSLAPEVSAELAAVIQRCLEKDAALRYASATELGAALAPLRTEPSVAASDALLARVGRARRAIEDAATTPASVSPVTPIAPASRPAATPSSSAPASAARGSWLTVAALTVIVGVVAVGSMYAGDSFLTPPSPPASAPAEATVAEADASSAPEVPAGVAAGPALDTDVHPRPCLAPPTHACAPETRAWCHPEGTRVACCGAGLVPTLDGLCECPPGGANDPTALADGCAAPTDPAAGTATYVRVVLRQAVRDHVPAFRRCYESALEDHTALSGRLVLAWTISPWGDVWDPRLDGATLPSADVQRCVLAELATLRVDPPLPGTGATLVTYPVDLRPSE